MEELTSIKKLKWEMKKKQIKETVTTKVRQASNWCQQNKEFLVVAIPAATVTAKHALRMGSNVARGHAAKVEERDRDTRFYDHSLGCYWRTKRPLRQDELLAVQRRRAAGESYGDIFASMKLLK